jgi:hypothetical protein
MADQTQKNTEASRIQVLKAPAQFETGATVGRLNTPIVTHVLTPVNMTAQERYNGHRIIIP